MLHLELRKPPGDEVRKLQVRNQQQFRVEIETKQNTNHETDTVQEKTEDKESSKPTLKELANQSKKVKDKEKVNEEDMGFGEETDKDDVEKTDLVEVINEKEGTQERVKAEGIADTIGDDSKDTKNITETEKIRAMEQNVEVTGIAKEFVEETEKNDGEDFEVVEETGSLTAEDVCAGLEKKREMLLQEDTTDSEVIVYNRSSG